MNICEIYARENTEVSPVESTAETSRLHMSFMYCVL